MLIVVRNGSSDRKTNDQAYVTWLAIPGILEQNKMTEFKQHSDWYQVKQESTRAKNSLGELLSNPVLLINHD